MNELLPMITRVHVHIKVRDLAASRDFYERLFGEPPVKLKPDQIKFLPSIAPLNLALTLAGPHDGFTDNTINHLGVELESVDAVLQHLARVKAVGIAAREQLKVNCCYANQTKFWVIDPDGVEWELYHVNFDLIEKHGAGVEQLDTTVAD